MHRYAWAFTLVMGTVTGIAHADSFAAGDLAVLQAAASASNTTCSVVEIDAVSVAQAAKQIIPIPGASFRISGSATSTGYVSRTADRTLLTFTGVNSANTTANVNTLNPRVVGTLSPSATFTQATSYTGASGQQTRSATSLDNATWYIADQQGLYTNGASAASPSANLRGIKAFSGAVYVGTASATLPQVSTVSAPSGGTLTALPGLPAGSANFQDFYLVQSGASGSSYDVLYMLLASSNTAGTIQKYSLVGGTWTTNGSVTTSFGGFGLTAAADGGGAALYITTGQGALTANSVVKLRDQAGYNATISTAAATTLYTAAAGTILKGIDFAPAAPPPAACAPGSSSATGAEPCAPCAAGSYQDLAGQTSCHACSAGSSQSLAGQTACVSCAAGSSQSQTGQSACVSCAAGTYQDQTGQSACVSCAAGSFQDQAGQTACQSCAAGSYQDQTGQSACVSCAAGSYQDQTGQSTCLGCAAGSFQDQAGRTQCQSCAAGSYQDQTGQNACVSCAAGTYQDQTGQSACISCAAGSSQGQAGQSTCVSCAAGSYQSQSGQNACVSCAVGSSQNQTGQNACVSCSPGSSQSQAGQNACVSCMPGSYQDQSGQSACLTCMPGSFQSAAGSSACLPCAAGTAAPTAGSSQCTLCPENTFAADAGAGVCTACPEGQVSNETRTVCVVPPPQVPATSPAALALATLLLSLLGFSAQRQRRRAREAGGPALGGCEAWRSSPKGSTKLG